MKKVLFLLFLILFPCLVKPQSIIVRLDTITAQPGDSVVVPVWVNNFVGVGSATFFIQYDQSILQWGRAINWNSQLLQGVHLAGASNGILSLVWFDINGASIADGKFVDLKFRYLGSSSTLVFTPSCEITDLWSNPVIPPPAYSNGLVKRKLQVVASANPMVICTGDSTHLGLNVFGGAGNVAYQWTSVPEGFASTLTNPWVFPAVTTTYTVFATDGIDSSHSSVTVTAYFFVPPNPVENMLPADSSQGLSVPLLFTWSPSANAVTYDFYLWKEGEPLPSIPYAADLTSISYLLSSTLDFGMVYHWKVLAKNPCMSAEGPVQSFTTRFLPDLIIHNVQVPALAFSGQIINITWQVKNQGLGGTLSTNWYDHAFLSTDTTLETDLDFYIGSYLNLTSLNPDESYQQNVAFTLPQGISGYYYLIIWTDRNNNLPETVNSNNTGFNHDSLLVTLSPTPDLRVEKIIIPNSTFSGQVLNVTWKVKNYGQAPTPIGTWHDRVYLTQDSLLLASATNMGTFQHFGVLAPDSTYTLSANVNIPNYVHGKFYIFLSTDIFNAIYEHALENNNSLRSDSLIIFLTPPPDLVCTSVIIPDSASNNQNISVSWTVQNQGANAATGGWYDNIYLSNSMTLNTNTAFYLGSIYHGTNLLPDESYSTSKVVIVPQGINGPYNLFVFADVKNNVFEFDQEENNIRRSLPLTVLSPDLVIDTVVPPDTANSGQLAAISYVVMNQGPGRAIGSWVERIYISKKSSFLLDSCYYLGNVANNYQNLDMPDTLQRSIVSTLPHGIFGEFYVYVYTDYHNSLYEYTAENNNVTRSPGTMHINLTPWPDLSITNITLSEDTATAGFVYSLSYTVKNNGPGPTPLTIWRDRIGISYNAFEASPFWAVKVNEMSAVLEPDSSYTIHSSFSIPIFLGNQFYYFYISTDYQDHLYEYTGEGNNLMRSDPVYIEPYPPVDLATVSFTAPVSASSGGPASIQWTIQNMSQVPTYDGNWTDVLYISGDTVWDPAGGSPNPDLEVGLSYHAGHLAPGQSSTTTKVFNIPNGISGDYYLIMVADRQNKNQDVNFSNNVRFVLDGSNHPIPIHIILTPPPDLVVTSLIAPNFLTSGQPVKIKWTVKNNGVGPVIGGGWSDKAYISSDFVVDAGDLVLGGATKSGSLAVGASYTDSMEVTVPLALSGNYIMVLYTDAVNNVFEMNHENNNTRAQAILLQQPPPCDLIVSQIIVPPNVMAGDSATIQWKLKNIGANPVSGYMKDMVYFSQDTVWDIDDIYFGAVQSWISIGINATANRSLKGSLNGVTVGQWYAIVRTDVLNNINESNDGNNAGYSDQLIEVDVPELPLNIWTHNPMIDEQYLYYRITIPSELSGESMIVKLRGDSIYGTNELYLRFGNTPSRTEFDYAFSKPSYGNQEIIVPSLFQGTYYLMVYGNTSIGNIQDISLFAKILDFEILYVQDNQGGNTGKITVKLIGSKFTPTMGVYLQQDETVIEGDDLQFVNPSEVYVTFPLIDAIPGFYNVVADKRCDGKAILQDGFEVLPGSPPSLEVNVYQPASARPSGIISIIIEYTNAGNVDLVAPDLEFKSVAEAPVSLTVSGLGAGQTSLVLQLREPLGPPGLLRPGVSGTIVVYSKATKGMAYILKLPNY